MQGAIPYYIFLSQINGFIVNQITYQWEPAICCNVHFETFHYRIVGNQLGPVKTRVIINIGIYMTGGIELYPVLRIPGLLKKETIRFYPAHIIIKNNSVRHTL